MWTGLLAVAVALVSPLDAAAGSLAAAHMAQHVMLVLVAAPAAHGARRIDRAQALLVFAAGLQGVLLSALLTFSGTAWHAYGDGPALWGLTPLADQQLAGVLLWGTGVVVHLAAVLLLAAWLRESEPERHWRMPSTGPGWRGQPAARRDQLRASTA